MSYTRAWRCSGSGSVLAGMVLGSMAAFIIDRKLTHAAAAAFIGAALAFIGLIHGPHLGWMVSPLVALGYAMFGARLPGAVEAASAELSGCELSLCASLTRGCSPG